MKDSSGNDDVSLPMNDWSQDGRNRRVAWLTVYPTVGMTRQHLPILPMTRVMIDSIHRMGHLTFTAPTRSGTSGRTRTGTPSPIRRPGRTSR
ncbi:hypothetical protein [Streptomyces sp. 4F14]|uniref:hypothetical protein n=1 Tax=Streptomyces sp. 4F14 TaxID=3394380 RepID=UPI003A84C312